jgi:dihydroorotase
LTAPSGGPLIQHSYNAMLELFHQGKISLEMIVQKMCHNVAELFEIDRRGFIREGFYADLVLVNINEQYTVSKNNLLYKCNWSPFEGQTLHSVIKYTIVNGNIVYDNGVVIESVKGKRLLFNR